MPLGWGEVTGIIPKLVTQGPFGFPTRHSWLRHLWLVGNPNGLSWLLWELFFPFTRGKPLVKGKSPCLRLSLKASRHSIFTVVKRGNFLVDNYHNPKIDHLTTIELVCLHNFPWFSLTPIKPTTFTTFLIQKGQGREICHKKWKVHMIRMQTSSWILFKNNLF